MTIHTDGACRGNPGPGGWAAILVAGRHIKELSGGDPATTNNRMELTALLEGLRALKIPCNVTVYTDSQCVVGWLSQGWKRKNPEIRALCAEIDLLVAGAQHQVRYEWVRGHAGDPMNERVDALAVQAIP